MEKLPDQIKEMEFVTGRNFSYDLDREFNLISSYLSNEEQELLRIDFERFFEQGRFLVFNSFAGGILFLKVPESVQKVKIESRSNSKDIEASVVFASESRKPENIKYKPEAGKTESVQWNIDSIFPNFFKYQKTIQKVLLLLIGKIVKRICEYGRKNFAYMELENEFNIEFSMDGQVESQLKVDM